MDQDEYLKEQLVKDFNNKKKTTKFEKLGCEFLNEDDCEEELEDEDLSVQDAEKEYFDEGNEVDTF